jgi:hypothetical protein
MPSLQDILPCRRDQHITCKMRPAYGWLGVNEKRHKACGSLRKVRSSESIAHGAGSGKQEVSFRQDKAETVKNPYLIPHNPLFFLKPCALYRISILWAMN